MLIVAIGRRQLIFSDVTFKMAAKWPYWIFRFPDSNFSLALNIKPKETSVAHYLWLWAEAYRFSAMLLSKWLLGVHIEFFGFRTLNLV